MTKGPFTDDMVRHYLTSVQTQAGIQKYVEAMAQVLTKASCASQKVTGNDPHYAVDRWIDVIRKRAHEILHEGEPRLEQRIPKP